MTMMVREKLNRNPVAVIAVAAVAVVVAAIAISYSLRSPPQPSVPAGVYFTVDDGKSFFVDDPVKIPPFIHEGKAAYGACVVKCGGEKKVLYLTRYTPLA